MITALTIDFIENLLEDTQRPRYSRKYFKNTTATKVLITFCIVLCFPVVILDILLSPIEILGLLLCVIIKRIGMYLNAKKKK